MKNVKLEKREVKFKKLSENAVLPHYATAGAAGFDFHAAEGTVIEPHQTVIVKTDLAVELPTDLELQVRCRSGIAFKTPLIVKNAPGTVDSDYRGNIGIILHNLSDAPYLVEKGERIAQGVIAPVVQINIVEADELSDTDRGEGGFGSTGTK